MHRRWKTLSGVSALLALAACGQTGALYLPEASGDVVIRQREAATPEGTPAPAPEAAPPNTR